MCHVCGCYRGDGSDLESTLCKYDLRKSDFIDSIYKEEFY